MARLATADVTNLVLEAIPRPHAGWSKLPQDTADVGDWDHKRRIKSCSVLDLSGNTLGLHRVRIVMWLPRCLVSEDGLLFQEDALTMIAPKSKFDPPFMVWSSISGILGLQNDLSRT